MIESACEQFLRHFLYQKEILWCKINEMDFGIIVSEFEFWSCYYVHFRTNTLGNDMKSLIHLLAIGYIEQQLYFYKDGFGIK